MTFSFKQQGTMFSFRSEILGLTSLSKIEKKIGYNQLTIFFVDYLFVQIKQKAIRHLAFNNFVIESINTTNRT